MSEHMPQATEGIQQPIGIQTETHRKMTRPEAALNYGVSTRTIDTWLSRGKLQKCSETGKVIVPLADIQVKESEADRDPDRKAYATLHEVFESRLQDKDTLIEALRRNEDTLRQQIEKLAEENLHLKNEGRALQNTSLQRAGELERRIDSLLDKLDKKPWWKFWN